MLPFVSACCARCSSSKTEPSTDAIFCRLRRSSFANESWAPFSSFTAAWPDSAGITLIRRPAWPFFLVPSKALTASKLSRGFSNKTKPKPLLTCRREPDFDGSIISRASLTVPYLLNILRNSSADRMRRSSPHTNNSPEQSSSSVHFSRAPGSSLSSSLPPERARLPRGSSSSSSLPRFPDGSSPPPPCPCVLRIADTTW